MLERITITIKKELLDKIDSIIDDDNIKNRSRAIESLIKKSFDNELNTALIMAGADNSPSMTVFNGKPILEHQIEMLKNNGIKNMIVSLNKNDKKTQDYFSDGKRFGINIKYIVEDKPLGTCGAISFMKEEMFAMLNVDTLVEPDIRKMHESHIKNNAVATLLVTAVKDPKNFGSVRIQGNKVIEFLEKPKIKDPSLLINAGFCIFSKNVLKYTDNKKQMVQNLFNNIINDNKLYAFIHDRQIKDVLHK